MSTQGTTSAMYTDGGSYLKEPPWFFKWEVVGDKAPKDSRVLIYFDLSMGKLSNYVYRWWELFSLKEPPWFFKWEVVGD